MIGVTTKCQYVAPMEKIKARDLLKVRVRKDRKLQKKLRKASKKG